MCTHRKLFLWQPISHDTHHNLHSQHFHINLWSTGHIITASQGDVDVLLSRKCHRMFLFLMNAMHLCGLFFPQLTSDLLRWPSYWLLSTLIYFSFPTISELFFFGLTSSVNVQWFAVGLPLLSFVVFYCQSCDQTWSILLLISQHPLRKRQWKPGSRGHRGVSCSRAQHNGALVRWGE